MRSRPLIWVSEGRKGGAGLEVPAEFLMDGGEEALVVETDELDGEAFAGEGDLGAAGELLAAGVGAEVEGGLLAVGDEAQLGGVGDDDGAEGEVVGSVGGDDEAGAVGGEDGAAAAEGVGCGACGGGYDEAVAGIGGHEVVVDKEVGGEEGAVEQTVEGDFVEGKGLETLLVGAGDDMEEGAGLDGVEPGEEVVDEAVDVVTSRRGEESEVAEVDAEDGDVAVADEVDGAEEGAVASDGEEEVEMGVGYCVGDFFGLDSVALEDVDELAELLAQGFFDVAGVEGDFHVFVLLLGRGGGAICWFQKGVSCMPVCFVILY